MQREIDVKMLEAHPMNREFSKSGELWEEFVESVREHGVVENLFVRPMGKKHQILAGHRRFTAAQKVGLMFVPCHILELDDKEAIVFLMNSNLQRENMNLMDEASLIRELGKMGMNEEEICTELSRSMDWIKVRQEVFSFDDETIEDIRSGRLSEGLIAEVIKAPIFIRERALMVVCGGGEDFDEPLSAVRAHDYIQFTLIPEWEKETEWEENREKVRKQVTKDLAKLCKGAENPPTVLVMPWGRGADGLGGDLVSAKDLVPIEYVSPDDDERRTWAWCASNVGAPIYVLAPEGISHEKRLLVSRKVLIDDASARLSHGAKSYLMAKPGAKRCEAVAKAEAVLNGEGEKDYNTKEPVSEVATPGHEDGMKIEQRMEHAAMIDIGKVKWLGKIAFAHETDPDQDMHQGVPSWARYLINGGNASAVCDAMDWVLSLKVGGDK